jgi:LysR family glycine cleavage system transcriptional activator
MARRLPSLNALKAFEAAARHESFTLAAAELSVTHAAISRHIRDLEQWLGVPLFARTGRGVELSIEGRRLGSRLTPHFDGIAAATADVSQRRERRRLIVSAEVSFAALWLVPRLGEFTGAHPDIELVLDPADRLVDFDRDVVDAGIRHGSGNWQGVVAEKLVDVAATPVCCPDLLAASGVETPADLAGQTLLREDMKELWQSWLEAAGVAGAVVPNGPVLKGYLTISAAEAGQGFALSEPFLAAEALIGGRLMRPFPAITIRRGAYFLVRSASRPETAAVKALREWLRAEIARTQAALEEHVEPAAA